MVGRKKKTKVCEKELKEEDLISNLHEPLISEILLRLSTKDAVRTSLLSKSWRYLWQSVPGLDLSLYDFLHNNFSNIDAFLNFVERFFDSHRESWIRKLRLFLGYRHRICDLKSWINAVTRRKIQHLDVNYYSSDEIPVSIYTCETLVQLRLKWAGLPNAEYVSLPCLKIMHLERIRFTSDTTLEKLISGSPVLEDLKIFGCSNDNAIQVRSHTLKRINMDMDESSGFVIDAPLLQCLSTKIASTKDFQIISSDFPTKLDIDLQPMRHGHFVRPPKKVVRDILTDIRRVRDLVITSDILKEFFLYSKSRTVRQFRNLSRLNARFTVCDLEMLPALLESCTKLESLILDLFRYSSIRDKEKREPNVVFEAVPRCLVSSLKFVELKLSFIKDEGEMELARYFLKNSTILEKLRLNVCRREKSKCDYLTELVAMKRSCSSACQVLVL
ncbi:PREDICTED: F-box/FBD/LRR-repeat protein At1g51370-like [Camelina sativa]|uniref:F-box/FBD/LRR-repeat protein At1g51370-like n=1 Tax=Camelina sativa TaxID=90675 RepID=A0ABM1RGW8_CAMSA|nr:PREDICTED: F-box/FBD/LRR-repeat protein At1g51370-like [Camelina sativa]